jgi:phosphoribosylformylglycinamidine synthase
MWQFSQVIDGMTKACEELETPITGGNVSFYNETLGEGIYPTPVMGIVGILEDVSKAMKPHFREAGRTVVVLHAGESADMADVEAEFGSSEYAKEILGTVWGYPPELDLEKESALQKALIEIIQAGLVESAHDCADGGLAVALAESGFLKNVGVRVNLKGEDIPAEFVLFGEDPSRVVLSCAAENVEKIRQIAVKYGVAAEPIGETVPQQFEFAIDGKVVVSAPTAELKDAWANALERALHTETEERLVPEVLQRS